MRRWNLREVSLLYVLGPWVSGRQTALTPFQWTLVLRHNYYLSSSVSVSSSPLHLSCANVTVLVWQFGLPEQKTDCWKTSGFPDLKKGRKKKQHKKHWERNNQPDNILNQADHTASSTVLELLAVGPGEPRWGLAEAYSGGGNCPLCAALHQLWLQAKRRHSTAETSQLYLQVKEMSISAGGARIVHRKDDCAVAT